MAELSHNFGLFLEIVFSSDFVTSDFVVARGIIYISWAREILLISGYLTELALYCVNRLGGIVLMIM